MYDKSKMVSRGGNVMLLAYRRMLHIGGTNFKLISVRVMLHIGAWVKTLCYTDIYRRENLICYIGAGVKTSSYADIYLG
jgi:hypothetical protein